MSENRILVRIPISSVICAFLISDYTIIDLININMSENWIRFLIALGASTVTFVITNTKEWIKNIERLRKIRTVIINNLEKVILPSTINFQEEQLKAIEAIDRYKNGNWDSDPEGGVVIKKMIFFNTDVYNSFQLEDISKVFPYSNESSSSYLDLIRIYKVVDVYTERQPGELWDEVWTPIHEHHQSDENTQDHLISCALCSSRVVNLFHRLISNRAELMGLENEIKKFLKREKSKGIFY
jgi:hypothetical protein